MAHQASKKRGPLPPDHQRIGCCTNNGITPQKVQCASGSLDESCLGCQNSAFPSILHPSTKTQGAT